MLLVQCYCVQVLFGMGPAVWTFGVVEDFLRLVVVGKHNTALALQCTCLHHFLPAAALVCGSNGLPSLNIQEFQHAGGGASRCGDSLALGWLPHQDGMLSR